MYQHSLREQCPNTEFFWSVFSKNAGKYRPEKTPHLETFHAVNFFQSISSKPRNYICQAFQFSPALMHLKQLGYWTLENKNYVRNGASIGKL